MERLLVWGSERSGVAPSTSRNIPRAMRCGNERYKERIRVLVNDELCRSSDCNFYIVKKVVIVDTFHRKDSVGARVAADSSAP